MTSFSIDKFSTAPSCCYGEEKNSQTTVFGDKILDLESDFWKSGCVPVLRSLIRILRESLVQINTEMAEKYSNQRYAVNLQWKISRKYQIFAQNHDLRMAVL